MWSKVIFGHRKLPPAAMLWKKKVAHWSEIARNAIKSDFRSSKMTAGSHFMKKKVAYWSEMARNAIKIHFRSSKMGGGASQWPACKPFGDIHSICPWANTPILVYYVVLSPENESQSSGSRFKALDHRVFGRGFASCLRPLSGGRLSSLILHVPTIAWPSLA